MSKHKVSWSGFLVAVLVVFTCLCVGVLVCVVLWVTHWIHIDLKVYHRSSLVSCALHKGLCETYKSVSCPQH